MSNGMRFIIIVLGGWAVGSIAAAVVVGLILGALR